MESFLKLKKKFLKLKNYFITLEKLIVLMKVNLKYFNLKKNSKNNKIAICAEDCLDGEESFVPEGPNARKSRYSEFSLRKREKNRAEKLDNFEPIERP